MFCDSYESVSPHLACLFPDPTHNGDLCMHFLFSPTVIDNVMNGFRKEGKALQQNGSLFFLTRKQTPVSFKKWDLHSFADGFVEWTITKLTVRQISLQSSQIWKAGNFNLVEWTCRSTQPINWWFPSWSLIKSKKTVEIL